jgi:uncharacterized Zn-finger protein
MKMNSFQGFTMAGKSQIQSPQSQTPLSEGIETIPVHEIEVSCDGGGGALGHPRVFLHIDRAVGFVTCGYCSRRYVLDGEAAHH